MDLIIYSSNIFTGVTKQPWAEAMAVKDGRIQAVGTSNEIKSFSDSNTVMIDLPGRLITPGIVDSHVHFFSSADSLQDIDLRNLPSMDACREKLLNASLSYKKGEWVIGHSWNQNLWKDTREPTKDDLDDIFPDQPAMMIRACTHSIWVNSKALEISGITADTPEPPGGRIDRDPDTGEPTGMIREAEYLVQNHIPRPDFEKRKKMGLAAQKQALQMGITSVHTMETINEWEILNSLNQEGLLKLRVYHLLPPEDLENAVNRDIFPGKGNDHLWCGHIKLFADGSLGARTALLYDPYEGDPDHSGIPFLTFEALLDHVQTAYKNDWNVAIHAIGDKALSNALSAIDNARKKFPGHRMDRIEHIQLYRPEDLELFHSLGVVASIQPAFVPSDWQAAMRHWGADRCRYAYAWKSIFNAGIPIQFGSDAPVEPNNPILGFHAAVTRQNLKGDPPGGWFPEQKITLDQCIKGYTRQPHITSGRSDILGTITPGKIADLTVFNKNLFELPPEHWPSVEVEMTIIQGEIVYQK